MKLKLLRSILNACYVFFTWIGPVKQNKITFCTNRSTKLTGNLAYLYKQFETDEAYAKKIICFNFERSFIGRLNYLYYSVTSLYHIATSRVFIVDDYFFPIYCLNKKRPENTIIQIWHAIGHLKRYGLSLEANRRKVIKPHTNYDWVLANAQADVPALAESFDVTEAQIIVTGAPRIDGIVEEFKKSSTMIKTGKSLMYAPTYRTASDDDNVYQGINDFIETAIATQLTDDYHIYLSLHPYIKQELIRNSQPSKIEVFQDSQRSSELLKEIDLLITDYSSIVLDYAFFEKPIYIFATDYDEYIDKVGFFVDYKPYIGAPFYDNVADLVQGINDNQSHDLSYIHALKKDNFDYTDGANSQRAAQFIKALMK